MDDYKLVPDSVISGQFDSHIASRLRLQNFRMFFSGLIFAVISFIGAHPIKTTVLWLKISEVISLFCLLTAGILILVSLSEARLQSDRIQYKNWFRKVWNWLLGAVFNSEKYRWIFFLIGIVMIVVNRSVMLFY